MSDNQILYDGCPMDKWISKFLAHPALDIGQKVRVKFGRGRYDAVVVESWKPKTKGMSILFFSFPFVGVCGLSKFSKRRL